MRAGDQVSSRASSAATTGSPPPPSRDSSSTTTAPICGKRRWRAAPGIYSRCCGVRMRDRGTGSASFLREDEDALLGEQICQAPVRSEGIGLAVTVEGEAALDADVDLVAHRNEVADRAEMNIGGFVPRMREERRHRHPATNQQVQPDPPKAEIRERDDRAPANADEGLEHLTRLARRLQGLAQHDDVEGAGGVGGEIPIGVPLNDRKAVAD